MFCRMAVKVVSAIWSGSWVHAFSIWSKCSSCIEFQDVCIIIARPVGDKAGESITCKRMHRLSLV